MICPADLAVALAIFAAWPRYFETTARRRSPAGLILEIDIRELLPGAVDHNEARF